MNTQNNPNFLKVLSPSQISWCESHGVEIQKGEGYGFYFSKGERFILPVPFTNPTVYLMEVDRSEDGDGERCVGTFSTLREGLKELVG